MTKKYLVILIGINLFFGLVLIVFGYTRIEDFIRYHKHIAEESTASLASDIGRFIEEKQRLVRIFSEDNIDLIRKLNEQPYNGKFEREMKRRLRRMFPNYFSFLITNSAGVPYKVNFDGFVGDICKQEIRGYVKKKIQQPSIHPNDHKYHFDVMSAYQYGSHRGVFFVSFDANILGNILKAIQASQHEVMLLDKSKSDLIEVISLGARNRVFRKDYRLRPDEKNRILFQRKIRGTVWTAVDMYKPELMSGFINGTIRLKLVIFLLFAAITGLIIFNLYREERKRINIEKEKDQLFTMISHDLRSPLASVIGALDVALAEVGKGNTEDTKQFVEMAHLKANEQISVINDLLDVKRLESGKIEVALEPLSIYHLVRDCIENNREYGKLYNVKYRLDSPAIDTMVAADNVRLNQVISNLLTNAAKYGNSDDTVTVTLVDDNEYVTVKVISRGPGVPKELYDHLFSAYTRGKQQKNANMKSTGLGLYLVKKIIDLHSGKVGFSSEPGGETVFYFSLPVLQTE